MKRLFILFLLPLLLSSCAIAYSEGTAPTPVVNFIPPGEPGGPPISTLPPDATKVVEMVTATPAAAQADPSSTPAAGLPKSLAEQGVTAAAFHDTVSGFAFDYPDGWAITDLSDAQKQNAMVYSISLRSFTPTPGPKQQDGPIPGLTAVDVTVFAKNGPKTLVQAVNERRASIQAPESGQPVTIIQEADWALNGGLPAHIFRINTGPLSPGGPDRIISELVTMVQGRMILVSGSGDTALVEAIAASLRAGE